MFAFVFMYCINIILIYKQEDEIYKWISKNSSSRGFLIHYFMNFSINKTINIHINLRDYWNSSPPPNSFSLISSTHWKSTPKIRTFQNVFALELGTSSEIELTFVLLKKLDRPANCLCKISIYRFWQAGDVSNFSRGTSRPFLSQKNFVWCFPAARN